MCCIFQCRINLDKWTCSSWVLISTFPFTSFAFSSLLHTLFSHLLHRKKMCRHLKFMFRTLELDRHWINSNQESGDEEGHLSSVVALFPYCLPAFSFPTKSSLLFPLPFIHCPLRIMQYELITRHKSFRRCLARNLRVKLRVVEFRHQEL